MISLDRWSSFASMLASLASLVLVNFGVWTRSQNP